MARHPSGEQARTGVIGGTAWVRVVVAVIAALVAGLLSTSTEHRSALQLVTGLVWVPAAALLVLVSDERRAAAVAVAGVALDLAMVAAMSALAPGGAAGMLVVAMSVAPLAAALGFAFEGAVREQRRSQARSALLEDKAAAVLDHVADAVVFTDGNGVLRECNKSGERVLDRRAAELVGRHCGEALALRIGERPLDCSAGCALLALNAGPVHPIEVWRPRPDGQRQPLLASASAIHAIDGSVTEVVHSIRDITRLKQADEAKTLFLATASHELKTPLTVISGFAATLLAHELEDHEKRYALEAIHTRASELARIVERLLLSSRIEAGRVSVRLRDVEVAPLLRERCMALERATQRSVDLEVDDAIGVIVADPDALVTVVDHLLDNAVKYSPNGEAVSVSAAVDGAVLRIVVRDRGIGMDAVTLAHCFDKFWQGESTDRRRFGGTGIGLYIVASLVEAMGGTVRADSRVGRGTSFTVTLSAARDVPQVERSEREPSIVREFMRQIGVPGGGG